MFINPKIAIEQGWIQLKGCTSVQDWQDRKFISPNAIDFTMDAVQEIDNTNESLPYIGEDGKTMRGTTTLDPVEGKWQLSANRVYDITSDMYVKVPAGVAALLVPRSTFARNGVIIASGIFDSGYAGHIGHTLYTLGGAINIQRGVRVGQIVFVKSESAGMYAGGWNHEEGTKWNTKVVEDATKILDGPAKAAGRQSFV